MSTMRSRTVLIFSSRADLAVSEGLMGFFNGSAEGLSAAGREEERTDPLDAGALAGVTSCSAHSSLELI